MKYCQLLLFLFLIGSCSLPKPDLEDFDADVWKNDPNGCKGDRNTLIASLYEQRDNLLGFNQNEIKYYLGKPDEQELYNRSQTFFHYQVSGSSECSQTGSVISLQIRFDALNRSNEIFFKNYPQ